jgi:hypothetical protein
MRILTGFLLTCIAALGQQPLKIPQLDRHIQTHPITFTLLHRRITPDVVTVKPGQYNIRFRNGMITAPITFDLGRKGVASQATDAVNVDHVHSSIAHGFFFLPPGTYEVVVREYPQYKATIQVAP